MAESKTLISLYEDITALTAAIAATEQQLQYVQKHGCLPEAPKQQVESDLSYDQVKNKIRRLNDLISKTKAKLKKSAKPSSQEKIAEWEEKVATAEIERNKYLILKQQMEDAGK